MLQPDDDTEAGTKTSQSYIQFHHRHDKLKWIFITKLFKLPPTHKYHTIITDSRNHGTTQTKGGSPYRLYPLYTALHKATSDNKKRLISHSGFEVFTSTIWAARVSAV